MPHYAKSVREDIHPRIPDINLWITDSKGVGQRIKSARGDRLPGLKYDYAQQPV
jgi:hypothetical protein